MKAKNKQIILKLSLFIGIVFLFTLSFNTAFAATDTSKIYVDKNGNDSWDGLSRVYNQTTGSGPKATINSAKHTLKTKGTIHIASGTYKESNIIIDKDLTIIGESQKGTIIQGINGKNSIFIILPGVKLTINNLTLTGSKKRGYGGAIYNDGTLTMNRCTITRNIAEEGGAIYNKGQVNLDQCTLKENYAEKGGAIYNVGVLTLDQCNFKENIAENGGAIYDLGNGYVTNCTFTGNIATSPVFSVSLGGAIHNEGTLTLTSCEFTNNTSDNYGGAIYNIGKLTATNCMFLNNFADGQGGAIYNNGDCSIINCNLSRNKAINGGAIYNHLTGTLTVINSIFLNNKAIWFGGAIFNFEKLTITGSRFLNNFAGDEGGAIINYNKCSINDCIFTGNNATIGGALSNSHVFTTMKVTNCIFTGNQAHLGGAIYNTEKLILNNSFFTGNQAYCGGAIYNTEVSIFAGGSIYKNDQLIVNNCTFNNNTAYFEGSDISSTCSRLNNAVRIGFRQSFFGKIWFYIEVAIDWLDKDKNNETSVLNGTIFTVTVAPQLEGNKT